MLVILAIVFGGYFYTVAGHLFSDAPPPALVRYGAAFCAW